MSLPFAGCWKLFWSRSHSSDTTFSIKQRLKACSFWSRSHSSFFSLLCFHGFSCVCFVFLSLFSTFVLCAKLMFLCFFHLINCFTYHNVYFWRRTIHCIIQILKPLKQVQKTFNIQTKIILKPLKQDHTVFMIMFLSLSLSLLVSSNSYSFFSKKDLHLTASSVNSCLIITIFAFSDDLSFKSRFYFISSASLPFLSSSTSQSHVHQLDPSSSISL